MNLFHDVLHRRRKRRLKNAFDAGYDAESKRRPGTETEVPARLHRAERAAFRRGVKAAVKSRAFWSVLHLRAAGAI